MSLWVRGTEQASIFTKSKNTWQSLCAIKDICRWTISWSSSWRQHLQVQWHRKRHTKPYHPWTNGGMVEHMNQTLKESTIKAYEYEGLDQLREHVQAFIRSKLQLRQSLEGAQVEKTIPCDVRGI